LGFSSGALWQGMLIERSSQPDFVRIPAANKKYRCAARAGNSDAMWFLAVNRLGRKGGACDYDEAVYWLEQASKRGHARACWALGRMYIKAAVVPHDPQQGMQLLERAARTGHREACLTLPEIYRRGVNSTVADPQKARHWYLRAESPLDRLLIRLGLLQVVQKGKSV